MIATHDVATASLYVVVESDEARDEVQLHLVPLPGSPEATQQPIASLTFAAPYLTFTDRRALATRLARQANLTSTLSEEESHA